MHPQIFNPNKDPDMINPANERDIKLQQFEIKRLKTIFQSQCFQTNKDQTKLKRTYRAQRAGMGKYENHQF